MSFFSVIHPCTLYVNLFYLYTHQLATELGAEYVHIELGCAFKYELIVSIILS
jgi:hypothetical protein